MHSLIRKNVGVIRYTSAIAAMLSLDIVRAKRTICLGVNRPVSPSVAILIFLPAASGELITKYNRIILHWPGAEKSVMY